MSPLSQHADEPEREYPEYHSRISSVSLCFSLCRTSRCGLFKPFFRGSFAPLYNSAQEG